MDESRESSQQIYGRVRFLAGTTEIAVSNCRSRAEYDQALEFAERWRAAAPRGSDLTAEAEVLAVEA